MPEILAVLERQREDERQAFLRSALIAATIVNVNRRKGARLVRAEDFLVTPRKEEDFMSVRDAEREMDRWAASINKRHARGEVS